ncbi:DUF3566 domain-containing protein [Streptomyces naphthomycinicus]|uniref:DUF3566 domain-containing protein n=1 Tax=Streptomyces naphthomycinicus TaxID=2872625 RepID=UPI001CECAE49|nr:DUF3566 domain-containing protein [Streptomyces sp. TML10]
MSRAKRRPRETARSQAASEQEDGSDRTRNDGPGEGRRTVPPDGAVSPAPVATITPAVPEVSPAPAAPAVGPTGSPVRRPRWILPRRSGPERDTPGLAAPPPGARAPAPRLIRLRISGADPWSVMVTSFLFLTGLGVTVLGAAGMLWIMLEAMTPDSLPTPATALLIAVGIVVLEVVLGTCLATLGSFLYNLSAHFSGGVEVAVTDAPPEPPPTTAQNLLLMARAHARRRLRTPAAAWVSATRHRLSAVERRLPAGTRRLPAATPTAGTEDAAEDAPGDGEPPRTATDAT